MARHQEKRNWLFIPDAEGGFYYPLKLEGGFYIPDTEAQMRASRDVIMGMAGKIYEARSLHELASARLIYRAPEERG